MEDKKGFKSKAEIQLVTSVKTKNGKNLISYTFFPIQKSGNWERVSYGEEPDFYIIFNISANSKDNYDKTLPTYKHFINGCE